jgi:hypothetical protein
MTHVYHSPEHLVARAFWVACPIFVIVAIWVELHIDVFLRIISMSGKYLLEAKQKILTVMYDWCRKNISIVGF